MSRRGGLLCSWLLSILPCLGERQHADAGIWGKENEIENTKSNAGKTRFSRLENQVCLTHTIKKNARGPIQTHNLKKRIKKYDHIGKIDQCADY